MRRLWSTGVACALASVVLATIGPRAATATDTLTLTSGLKIEGDITVEDEQVVKIRVRGRVMQFPRASISDVEYGPDSTAPSQIQQRETESAEDLKEAQARVKKIKIKKKKKEKKKEEPEEEVAGPTGGISEDGTLTVPLTPTPKEEELIKELRKGKGQMQAAKELGELKSVYAIPHLIRALDSDSPYVRREAVASLRKITYQNFGFVHDQRSRSERVKVIKQWQNWYEKASGQKVAW